MTVLIYSLTLRTGQYAQQIKSMVSQQAGYVVVQQKGYNETSEVETVLTSSDELYQQLKSLYPDSVITKRMFLSGLLNSSNGPTFGSVVAIEPEAEKSISEFSKKVKKGAWIEGKKDILVGQNMAETLGVDLGDKVVFSTQYNGEMSSQLFRVKGIFRTGSDEVDAFVAYIHHDAAEKLLEEKSISHQLAVHTKNTEESSLMKSKVEEVIANSELEILTWQEALPNAVLMIDTDKKINEMINFILMIIVYIGILNTILMSVMERMKELGVLLAIGMRPAKLAKMVLCEGLLIGIAGSVFGLMLGTGVSYHLITSGLDMSASMGESMEIDGAVTSTVIKGAYNWTVMMIYAGMTILFSVLSAAYPAWKITRLNPIEAMRQH